MMVLVEPMPRSRLVCRLGLSVRHSPPLGEAQVDVWGTMPKYFLFRREGEVVGWVCTLIQRFFTQQFGGTVDFFLPPESVTHLLCKLEAHFGLLFSTPPCLSLTFTCLPQRTGLCFLTLRDREQGEKQKKLKF
ncbi:hypothetical protein DPEC_G00332630 [Dallia pectoralis]|uniref:Uncharacterized protein n=1 Tax=Dallia pectoralis TaxID=75939 RepID=A0ACC2F640_DALPE|nr:hypothetical protein DPEC_G00332630 [Dallia pectoralis]